MLSSDASALSATLEALSSSALAAVQSASDAGFRDGLKQASASAQTAVDAPSASASCAAVSQIILPSK
jgi:hypothetical protein